VINDILSIFYALAVRWHSCASCGGWRISRRSVRMKPSVCGSTELRSYNGSEFDGSAHVFKNARAASSHASRPVSRTPHQSCQSPSGNKSVQRDGRWSSLSGCCVVGNVGGIARPHRRDAVPVSARSVPTVMSTPFHCGHYCSPLPEQLTYELVTATDDFLNTTSQILTCLLLLYFYVLIIDDAI